MLWMLMNKKISLELQLLAYKQKGISKRVKKKVHQRNLEIQVWIRFLLRINQFQDKKFQYKGLNKSKSQRNLSQYRKTRTVLIHPNNKNSTRNTGPTTSNKFTTTPYKKYERLMKPFVHKPSSTPKEQQVQIKEAATTTVSITTASGMKISKNKNENRKKSSNISGKESTVDNSRWTLQLLNSLIKTISKKKYLMIHREKPNKFSIKLI